MAAPNSTFAIDGVSCSTDSFVVKEGSVHLMNISAENRQSYGDSANH
jgi:hypothetical protein